jgi:hypothetical protein
MATTTATPTVPESTQAPAATNDNLVREKQTIKCFTRVARNADGTFKIDKKSKTPYREFQAKSSEKAWAKLLEKGWTEFSENSIFRYTLKNEQGFADLVEPAQRVRIQQAGINYQQSTKSNALAIAVKENTGTWKMAADGGWTEVVPAEPENNNTEFDMKELINQPPQKKKLSDYERVLRFIKSLGLPEDQFNLMVSRAQAQNAADEADSEEPESDEEDTDEAEGEDETPVAQ